MCVHVAGRQFSLDVIEANVEDPYFFFAFLPTDIGIYKTACFTRVKIKARLVYVTSYNYVEEADDLPVSVFRYTRKDASEKKILMRENYGRTAKAAI